MLFPHLPAYWANLQAVLDDYSVSNAQVKADGHKVYGAILVSTADTPHLLFVLLKVGNRLPLTRNYRSFQSFVLVRPKVSGVLWNEKGKNVNITSQTTLTTKPFFVFSGSKKGLQVTLEKAGC